MGEGVGEVVVERVGEGVGEGEGGGRRFMCLVVVGGEHGCSDSIQRVSFGNVTNPRGRPQILASNGLATKVIENALCPRALTIPYMVLNFAEDDGSAMELSNGTGCEDLSSWWRLVATIVERSFVRFSESGCSNREVLP